MILVIGATGQLGGTIARRLLARGDEVRILVRPSSDYQPLVELGAKPVIGDLKDRASLGPALRGVGVVVTTATAGSRGGEDTPETVDLAGNQHLIDAAAEAGVDQLVFTSTIGASADAPVPITRAKGRTEVALRESGVPHTILAAWPLLDVWVPMVIGLPLRLGQPVTLVGEGRRKHSFVSHADVASFAVAAIGHPAALGQTIPVGGPEAVSWRDIVEAVSRALGRPVPVRSVDPGAPVPGLPDFVASLMAFLESFDSAADTAPLARTFGVRQTPLEEVVRAMFARETVGAG
jgi:NADH dehydrogenase